MTYPDRPDGLTEAQWDCYRERVCIIVADGIPEPVAIAIAEIQVEK